MLKRGLEYLGTTILGLVLIWGFWTRVVPAVLALTGRVLEQFLLVGAA